MKNEKKFRACDEMWEQNSEYGDEIKDLIQIDKILPNAHSCMNLANKDLWVTSHMVSKYISIKHYTIQYLK